MDKSDKSATATISDAFIFLSTLCFPETVTLIIPPVFTSYTLSNDEMASSFCNSTSIFLNVFLDTGSSTLLTITHTMAARTTASIFRDRLFIIFSFNVHTPTFLHSFYF